jgi:hypothetical protein
VEVLLLHLPLLHRPHLPQVLQLLSLRYQLRLNLQRRRLLLKLKRERLEELEVWADLEYHLQVDLLV